MGYGPGWGRLVRAQDLMFSHSLRRLCRSEHLPIISAGMPLNVDASDECSLRHFEVATTQMR